MMRKQLLGGGLSAHRPRRYDPATSESQQDTPPPPPPPQVVEDPEGGSDKELAELIHAAAIEVEEAEKNSNPDDPLPPHVTVTRGLDTHDPEVDASDIF